MEIQIDNRQKKRKIAREVLEKTTRVILNALDCRDCELSVVIVDDREISELNETYLGREGPTNVIAFPMQEGEFSHITPGLLGDVVISADTARREADEAGMEFDTRFDELLVHGILHLLGYDHENDPERALLMEQKSAWLMEIIRRE